MAIVNFADKEALYENPNIAEKNKITDDNINLIKQVSQQTQKTIGVFTDDWSSSASYNVGDIAIYDNRVFQNLTGTNTATTPDQDTTNWQETTIAAMAAGAASGDTLPIGSIVPYGKSTAPANWLVCDGSAVSRTTYAELFAVIGTSFGAGDGSTTFNLPNLKGRVAVGQDTSDTDFDTIGETGGSKSMQKHYHTAGKYDNYAIFNTLTTAGGTVNALAINTDSQTASSRITTNETGAGTSGNLQPYQVVCYIIKAGQSAGLVANVTNAYSTSQTDAYSCEYVNNMFESNYDTTTYVGYIKYPDGTAICYGRYAPTGGINVGGSAGNSVSINLPITMIANSYIPVVSKYGGGNNYAMVDENVSSFAATQFTIGLWNNSGGASNIIGFNWYAIGKWK